MTESGGDKLTRSEKIAWRRDKPVEDPEKMKRWGFVSAQPSEYLIHYRKGKLREKSSGQGASCFKMPWDTVAIIPTTLKEVFFEANQITRENVEVRIKGMVLFHIVAPMKTYKIINFSFRERAEEKLAMAIADMCRSSAKWLVANMTVEQCIRKRKEEIAIILKKEVDNIVCPTDGKEGWGVSIENIDIQDVFILSDEIFKHIQEDFKNQKRLEAENSRLIAEQEMAKNRLENQKKIKMLEIEAKAATEIEEVKSKKLVSEAQKTQKLIELENEAQIKTRAVEVQKTQKMVELGNEAEIKARTEQIQKTQKITQLENEAELKTRSVEVEKNQKMAVLKNDAEVQLSEVNLQKEYQLSVITSEEEKVRREIERDQNIAKMKRLFEEIQFQLDKFRVEQNEQITLDKVKWSCQRLNIESEQKFHARELTVKGNELLHNEIAAFKRVMREINNAVDPDYLKQMFISKALPAIAQSFASQFGKINYTYMGGGSSGKESPLGVISQTFNQIMEVCKIHGIDLKKMMGGEKDSSIHDT